MEKQKKPICCICGKECENEFGNDPNPVVEDIDGNLACCNKCNEEIVIPARVFGHIEKNKNKKTNN